MVTKYPYSPNRKRRLLQEPVERAVKEHDWVVRRPFWVCRACDRKVDGSLTGSRVLLFSECPCGTEADAV